MRIVRRMKDETASDETAWITDFAGARERILQSGMDDLDTSRTGHRCRLWKELFRDNPALTTPFPAFKGYWGSYTIR
jgi:hypothetical protein